MQEHTPNPLPAESDASAEPDAPDTLLLTYLKNNPATCPNCFYDLTDAPTTTCQECGWKLELALKQRKRPHLWYSTGLIAWGSGLTLTVWGVVAYTIESVNTGALEPEWITYFVAQLLIQPLLFISWWKLRTRLIRTSPLLKWTLALAGCVVTVGIFGLGIWITSQVI